MSMGRHPATGSYPQQTGFVAIICWDTKLAQARQLGAPANIGKILTDQGAQRHRKHGICAWHSNNGSGTLKDVGSTATIAPNIILVCVVQRFCGQFLKRGHKRTALGPQHQMRADQSMKRWVERACGIARQQRVEGHIASAVRSMPPDGTIHAKISKLRLCKDYAS